MQVVSKSLKCHLGKKSHLNGVSRPVGTRKQHRASFLPSSERTDFLRLQVTLQTDREPSRTQDKVDFSHVPQYVITPDGDPILL